MSSEHARDSSVPRPQITEENKEFFQGAARGTLLLQSCEKCGHLAFYPRARCPSCLGESLSWVEASGEGAIYSFASVYRPQHPAFESRVPILLAAVQLAEGPIMIASLEGGIAHEPEIGMRVRVNYRSVDGTEGGVRLPIFELA